MEEINLPTPIESIVFRGHNFYLKRDDFISHDFSGNKARKLHYYLVNDFPHIKKLVSYGSNQSNAMYSMSILAKLRGWKFTYYTDHLSEYLKANPHGNYAKALQNGMHISVIPAKAETQQYINLHAQDEDNNEETLFINEGGRDKEAGFGLEIMAKEIIDWQAASGIQKLNIFLPSGTGTTALFLQKYLKQHGIKVYTTPCVGDAAYLTKQFSLLEEDTSLYPTIVNPPKKWHFGKLYKEHYKIWLELQKSTEITFDLLYDPIGWQVLMANLEKLDGAILYVHQGGLLGNESMLPRYERRFKDGNEDN
ncbi:MAG: 1-aminocyclopropane-1-carboxylate deaminase/D-cysteine desulfhydrase [Sulfurovaceae bacterium]